jgi:hypothetical protein
MLERIMGRQRGRTNANRRVSNTQRAEARTGVYRSRTYVHQRPIGPTRAADGFELSQAANVTTGHASRWA